MRFSFIDAKRAEFPVARLCKALEVGQSSYFAWKNRPASERQCKDMVLLAHIRERFRVSRETYGSPRMHADLMEDGIIAGRHRIARLVRPLTRAPHEHPHPSGIGWRDQRALGKLGAVEIDAHLGGTPAREKSSTRLSRDGAQLTMSNDDARRCIWKI
jgi:transposase InsO family protein